MAYQLKTKATDVQVATFLDAVPDARRRQDAGVVVELMADVTGEAPAMWGPTIVGYGRYRYTYDSGHSGEMRRLGFSPRKANLVLYLASGFARRDEVLTRLGKHKTGQGCLYLNRLADVDIGVLNDLVSRSWAWMNARYPAG